MIRADIRSITTGAVVAGLLVAAALVFSPGTEVVRGAPRPGDAVVPFPLGDSMRSGRGTDLAGMPAGGNPPSSPTAPTTEQPPPPPPPAVQAPGTVKLPQGGIATLVRKEVTADGVLPVPEGVGEATWWGVDLGAAEGATVLAGHVNWKGMTGPFDELWRSAAGQEVTVVDTAGKTFRFKISQVVTVRKDELPQRAVELFGPRGEHRLTLVTCGGRWVGGDTGYEENQVVVATPVA
ncbi:class F sortase [Actinosynnema sp. NPDC047251]|uniref:Peptidase C60, sortase A and B n=1 Tax=Saccharothrix espanaensis (strain ATCC 51144 / DSM 44229 / JCM 9112 / NBRC 15066 / NRRL 15764) TaxID=1179773 RepID=K0JVB3_SACES|nr:class F sortase [Saccharothrix espanaensis]CCH28098.1 Peptidase C60, sortase A and B [Saccharothrix espanaensis DSM 44229]